MVMEAVLSIILYQLAIFATLVVTRAVAPHRLTAACLIWTALTFLNLFWPPLIVLQLFVIWGTYAALEPGAGAPDKDIPRLEKAVDSLPAAAEPVRLSLLDSSETSGRPQAAPPRTVPDAAPTPIADGTREGTGVQAQAGPSAGLLGRSAHLLQQRAVQDATNEMLHSFDKEKRLVNLALDLALLEQMTSAPTEGKAGPGGARGSASGEERRNSEPEFVCTNFEAPPRHKDIVVADGIEQTYGVAVREYSAVLKGVAQELKDTPGLRVIFERELRAIGGSQVLARIECFEAGQEWRSPDKLAGLRAAARPAPGASPPAPGGPPWPHAKPTIRAVFGALSPELSGHAAQLETRKQIKAQAATRRIPLLTHFTRTRNLASILEHGLCSVERAEQLGIMPHVNDTLRLDGHRDAVSLSVGFPNYRMFFKYRQESMAEAWAVLIIDPAVLWEKRCGFCQRNAADHRMRTRPTGDLTSAVAFNSMFDEIEGLPMRKQQGLLDCDPTDPQAEVLVFSTIEAHEIKGIAFDNPQAANACSPLKGARVWQVFPKGKGLFASRQLYRQKGS
jgi:hypothetical protein